MKKNIFRTLFVLTLLSGATFFSSCDEEMGLEIDVPQTFETVYRLDPQTGTIFTLSETASVDLDSLLESQGGSRDNIEGIYWSSTELTVTDSNGNKLTGANFSNVKSVSMSIANPSAGLTVFQNADSVKMAAFGTNNPIIFLPANSVSISFLDYFANNTPTTFSSTVQVYSPVTTTVYIKSKVTITVAAKI